MAPELPADFVVRVTRRIAAIRRDKNLTQEQLAQRLGTATRNVQRLEAGQNLTLHTLARVAGALGVRPEELLSGPLADRRYAQPRATAAQVVSEKEGRAASSKRRRGDKSAGPRSRRRGRSVESSKAKRSQ